ncbi:MAG: PadR family transcriptional regulator [Syntrophomonas sp.]
MPRVNKTRYALLGLLNLKPGSGYDIKKTCDHSISFFWSENYGQIYPVLKQLEEEGLVSKETEYTEGKPARNIYYITEQGQEELNDWLMQPVEPNPLRMELLLKLLLSVDIPVSNTIEKLEIKRNEENRKLEYLVQVEESLRAGPQERKGLHLWLATISAGKHLAAASVDWCDETIAVLRQRQAEPKE